MEFAAEILDQVQRLFDIKGFNDHQLHCVLRFESAPDVEVLRKAVISSIEAIPILGTRYVDGPRPYWASLDRDDFARSFNVVGTIAEFEDFIVARADEGRGPQVRVCVLDASPVSVALTMNHMICDAAAFKEFAYFLCTIYSGLMADPAFTPRSITGDRSMRGVLEAFGMGVKLGALLSQGGDNNRHGDRRFPLSEGGEAKPFILTCKLGREKTRELKDYCRTHAATLDDAILTAYYRCLFRRLDLRPGEEVSIPVMVDMRRYLGKGAEFTSLTNLSSMVETRLAHRPEEGFADTLVKVKAVMDEKKAHEIGLNAFVKLDTLYRTLGQGIASRALASGMENPLICMTNVGILDSTRLAFGAARPSDAFMCGSIKYRPYFQLAMSTYEGEVTLSVNQYGGAGDRNRILSFLDEIQAELAGLA